MKIRLATVALLLTWLSPLTAAPKALRVATRHIAASIQCTGGSARPSHPWGTGWCCGRCTITQPVAQTAIVLV